ncbi:hypothetical protein DIPPA_16515 [Diplonema papillatum]|nr:hypothetical protein DIPPA_16515 [Diplonema papillatum]
MRFRPETTAGGAVRYVAVDLDRDAAERHAFSAARNVRADESFEAAYQHEKNAGNSLLGVLHDRVLPPAVPAFYRGIGETAELPEFQIHGAGKCPVDFGELYPSISKSPSPVIPADAVQPSAAVALLNERTGLRYKQVTDVIQRQPLVGRSLDGFKGEGGVAHEKEEPSLPFPTFADGGPFPAVLASPANYGHVCRTAPLVPRDDRLALADEPPEPSPGGQSSEDAAATEPLASPSSLVFGNVSLPLPPPGAVVRLQRHRVPAMHEIEKDYTQWSAPSSCCSADGGHGSDIFDTVLAPFVFDEDDGRSDAGSLAPAFNREVASHDRDRARAHPFGWPLPPALFGGRGGAQAPGHRRPLRSRVILPYQMTFSALRNVYPHLSPLYLCTDLESGERVFLEWVEAFEMEETGRRLALLGEWCAEREKLVAKIMPYHRHIIFRVDAWRQAEKRRAKRMYKLHKECHRPVMKVWEQEAHANAMGLQAVRAQWAKDLLMQ